MVDPTSAREKVVNWLQTLPWGAIFSFIVAIVVVGSAMYFVGSFLTKDGNTGPDIRDIQYARGFITVLFGVGTIGIALLVTLGAMFTTADNAKDRFDRGKEVLSLLLGIFGTIVGFYYGSAQPTGSASAPNRPTTTQAGSPATQGQPAAPPDTAKKGEEPAKAPPKIPEPGK